MKGKGKRGFSWLLVLTMILSLLPTTALAAEGDVIIDETNFPDATFRSYVRTEFDNDKDGTLTTDEIEVVRTILVYGREITTLKGIEHFTELESLDCYDNMLTDLDVSSLASLKYLNSVNNQLTSLDVSNNSELTELYCTNNQLTSLDVSNNAELIKLYCADNQLTNLNVNNTSKLTFLECYNNRLTSLDVSNNSELTELYCAKNQLTSLNASDNSKLMRLHCGANQLTGLDVNNASELRYLLCYDNQLTDLDVSNNSKLRSLTCADNQLTSLDVSNNSELTFLECSNNQLTSLDVSNNSALENLNCLNNTYKIAVGADRKFDLSTLPGSFDATKASNWVGGTVNGNILTVNEGATEVTYKYNAGNGNSVNFKLLVEVDASTHTHNWTDDYSGKDETHHWNICQSEGCDITEISLMDGYGEHVYTDDTDATCDTCGYEREVTEIHEHDWTTDYSGQNTTHHWNLCQNEGCNITESSLMDGYGEHNFGDDNICDTCGYTQPDVPATEFTITFDANGGKVDTKTATTEDGKLAVLPTPTRSGYRFKGWFTEDGTKVKTTTIFTEDTTVFAEWKKKSSSSGSGSSSDPTYSIKVEDTEHGDVKVSPSKVEKGDKVTITVKPDSGYELKDLTVTDKNGKELELKDIGNDKYTFTMSGSKVEVKPVFTKVDTTPQPSDFKATEKIVLTIDDTTMVIFGQTMKNDVAPVIHNERTMLPIRVIAEALGAKVVWDDSLNKVTITKDDFKIDIYIGSQLAFVNDKVVELDAPAFIENSRTYLPLRFVAENLGALVLWDDVTKEVTIVPNK